MNKKNIPVKKIIPVFIILILTGSLIIFNMSRGKNLTLRGEVEGTIYSQVSEVPGKIIEMNAQLGSPVKKGDLIARIDSTDQKYVLEQLEIGLEKILLMSQDELIRARNSVSAAQANYRSAEASYIQAKNDTAPLLHMWEIGGIARNDLDKAMLRETIAAQALENAESQLQIARSHLSLLQDGTDAKNIALADVDIRETESRIRQMQETLQKYEIRANCDGIVISINYNLGSMVNSGYNIADISAENEKFVVCYVPTAYSDQISYGQLLKIKNGKKETQGTICYIDAKNQYTPKDMQTSAMKNKISVKIKLLLPVDTAMIPGNKVDVLIK
ncbi:MAG: HlyD family efflux transporter periplasmic adaptor subunit [Treponema sp.]|nr:HlyD family efflux transporter periplasmic adaptor subunit [Treponema sp.]MCL2271456.1 HlyD family efflux transporter periplasmic adaptor subunit [Treponema sp.]